METLVVNQRRIAYVHTEGSCARRPGVMFCGGFKSSMQGLKALALEHHCKQQNTAFTRFDYNGHGESDGKFEEGDIGSWAQDAIAVFDQIASPKTSDNGTSGNGNSNGIIVIGSSMGAWIATLLARARGKQIAGLITLAAAPDFTEELLLPSLSQQQRATLKSGETLYLPSDYDDGSPYPVSANLIRESRKHRVLDKPFTLNAPLRLIHGTGDRDVPHMMSSKLMDVIQSDDTILTLIKNADHRLSSQSELKVITQTLQSLLT